MRIPSSVRTVADVIGMEGAVRLLQVARNNQVYVPAGPLRPGHPIANVLQPHELSALQRHFGGELVPYATARGAKRKRAAQRKREAIRELIAEGLSSEAIAERLGVSGQMVRRVRATGSSSSRATPPPFGSFRRGAGAGKQNGARIS